MIALPISFFEYVILNWSSKPFELLPKIIKLRYQYALSILMYKRFYELLYRNAADVFTFSLLLIYTLHIPT